MKQTTLRRTRLAVLSIVAMGMLAPEAFAHTLTNTPAAGDAPAVDNHATAHANLAKASQNPIANLISVPIQNNFNFGVGVDDDVQYSTLFQPVVPVSVGDKWNLINRTIIPIEYQPRMTPTGSSAWGLGDIQWQGYMTPKKASKVTWGVGPVVNLPTASDSALGAGKLSLGAGLVVLTMPGDWVIGALVNNIWSVAGSGNRGNVNELTFQYFVNYNIPKSKGWYLSSSPTMTANWNASDGQSWTVPVGGGVGKLFHVGKQHLNAKIQAFAFPAKPVNGPEWGIQFQLTFLFPEK